MEIARLRYMIDQIARNLEARGHEAAVRAVADHIAKFWDPRMKEAIFADDRAHLTPISAEAVDLLAQGGAPPPQSHATEFNAVDESGHSDAG